MDIDLSKQISLLSPVYTYTFPNPYGFSLPEPGLRFKHQWGRFNLSGIHDHPFYIDVVIGFDSYCT